MAETQDYSKLCKFTKILALKVAQVVVQSRQGRKITHDAYDLKSLDNGLSSSPSNLQWFNLSIPDEPDVNNETKKVINGEVVAALSSVLCIEISLKTAEGDEMVLEMWTVKMAPGSDPNMTSISTIYYRMSVMLKSTLTISRITPAYKMSRAQNRETYKIFHRIYGGPPNMDKLGEQPKTIRVGELPTPVGALVIEVVYRTKMAITPDSVGIIKQQNILNSNDIMVKSDHFPRESTRKKELDLNKPLTAGAFVDAEKMRELHASLNKQLLPEPPMQWMLAEEEKMDEARSAAAKDRKASAVAPSKAGSSCAVDPAAAAAAASAAAGGSVPRSSSKAIEMPRKPDRYASVMDFPFADGSPIADLATFYQECVQARSASDEWTELLGDTCAPVDSASLGHQLKMYEDAVPEFDSMVASMFSNSDGSDA